MKELPESPLGELLKLVKPSADAAIAESGGADPTNAAIKLNLFRSKELVMKSHTVKELVQVAFDHAGLDWEKYVKLDPAFIRPAEVDLLIGDPAKAKKQLGWTPKVSFEQLVKMMVDSDIEKLSA